MDAAGRVTQRLPRTETTNMMPTLSTEDQHELLADYLPHCTTVLMPAKPPKTPPCRDAFDVPFLQLAIVGKADYLVTGDQDLLTLHGAIRCPIISADEFLTLITST